MQVCLKDNNNLGLTEGDLMSNSIDRMELPQWYDENKMVLMVVNPNTVYVYWEFAFSQNKAMRENQLIVRLFEQTPDYQPQELVKSVALPPFTDNWYFNDLQPDHDYRADLGWEQNGVFYSLIKSNIVNVPPADPLNSTGQTKWQPVALQQLHKIITTPTARPTETVNEVVEKMPFYMGIHEKS